MAGVSQTASNASPAAVDEVGAVMSANQEEHSQSSTQELCRVETPCRSGLEESDSSLESKTPDQLPDENILGNELKSSEENLMRFAEILYKCTLCTSLPSILTSKDSFLAHVTKEHLTKQTSVRDCSQCDLKFGTDEDLRAHIDCAHSSCCVKDDTDSQIPVSLALSPIDSPKSVSPAMDDKCQGPRVPMYVLNSPKAPPRIESPNPTKKDFPCNKYQVVKPSAPVVKVNDLPKSETMSKIQKLTDQIVQSQTPGTQANLLQSWSSMSSFTPEFGRYTKLVREGGNIVYFCQVCNWKCQVKAAFQAHCNGPHHNNKVRIADQNNPHRKRGGPPNTPTSTSPALSGGSPNQCRSPSGLLMVAGKSDSENHRADTSTPCPTQMEQKRPDSLFVPSAQDQGHSRPFTNTSIQDMPFLQGLLFNNQRTDESRKDCNGFTFQRRWEKERTPENGNPRLTAESFFEKAKRDMQAGSPADGRSTDVSPTEQEHVSLPRNKRKRPTPVSLRNQTCSKNSWSDSDSDEFALKTSDSSSSDSEQPNAKKHKESDSPVRRDDFHSRLIKKIVTGPSQKDKAGDYPQRPAQHDQASPYLQNSFRNRLFASAFGASFGPMYGWFGQPNPLFQTPLCSSDENGTQDNTLSDNPFKNSIHYGSKLFPNTFTPFDYSGKHRQISEALCARNKYPQDTSGKGDNSLNPEDTTCEMKNVIKQEPVDRDDSVFRCSMCEYTCQDIHNYRHHFMAEHGIDGADSFLGESQFSSMNEGWKMSKIRDCLPDILVESSKGNVSRDILLQKVSLLLGLPEVIHWGPACNKAVREVFQNSLAQRKGKYKKTYFFGVALMEQVQEQDDLSDSENITYQPLRDMSQDLERILEHLPDLVYWTGEGDTGVSRDELLELLASKIEEKDVQHWGVQCNRAMRMLFPEVQMKRKGKYKTVFFGVDYSKNLQKTSFIPTKRGRPRKLNDDDDDDAPASPPLSTPTCLDKNLLAWRTQMQHMKFFSQPRFQHHWRGEDGSPLIPQYPPRDGPTEISKDYNFLASELRNSYLTYHHLPFGFSSGFPATVQHKASEPEPEMVNDIPAERSSCGVTEHIDIESNKYDDCVEK